MAKIGVDVSKYNGKINWEQAKKSGVQFAILRLGSGYNGGYIDKTFDYNYRECKRVGIPIGCYIASYLNIDTEIELTKQAIKNKQFEYPIYFDIEDFSIKGKNLTKSQITFYTTKYLKEIEKLGCYVGIYTNRAFLNRNFNYNDIKNYDIWIAHWSRYVNYKGVYPMHQFTNSMKWTGIPSTGEGGVDTNYCYIDYPTIIKANGLNGYKKDIKKEVKKMEITKEIKDQLKNTVVTFTDKNLDKALKIAEIHKALLVPCKFNLDFGKMVKSGDTIIAIGEEKLGKIKGKNYGLTNYSTYHIKDSDNIDDFIKDRYKFLVKK